VAVNIQGVTMSGWDHIGLTVTHDMITASCWNDDEDDWPIGERWGGVWTFRPLAPDHKLPGKLKGVMNTRQTFTQYGEPQSPPVLAELPYLPFADFPYPDERNVFHGTWVEEELWKSHESKQKLLSWEEWAD
jgi:hypothetical protein